MTSHLNSNDIFTIEEFKEKSKIVERQKVTIKTLRFTITQLINENELLIKRNKELEQSLQANTQSTYELKALSTINNSTPVPPPRSPYRAQDKTQLNSPILKRPPNLNLTKSNHQPIEVIETIKADYLASPNKAIIPLSSPSSSSTSFSSSSDRDETDHTLVSPKHHDNTNKSFKLNTSKSEPNTPVYTPRTDSLAANNFTLQLSKVHLKLIRNGKKNGHPTHFLFAITQKEDPTENWRIEKTMNDLIYLDTKLKELNPTIASHLKKLPEKSLFSSSSPLKVNETKNMIEEYLRHALSLNHMNNQILYEFIMTNKIQESSKNTVPIGIKQGYLSKKKRGFGGWKTRYFILDHQGTLKYYESKRGQLLGSINLSTCQIISETAPEDHHHKHTFLLLEQKSSNAYSTHTFSALSNKDKSSWIRYLTQQVNIHGLLNTDQKQRLILEPSGIPKSKSHEKLVAVEGCDFSNRRKSSTSIPNPTFTIDNTSDEISKKSKHKHHRKTFWPMKMFSGHHHELLQDLDHEETVGENQVFGIPLEDAVSKSHVCEQYGLPAIVYRCIAYIEANNGLKEEGIYRQSGSTSEINSLRKRFNDLGDVKLLEDGEFHDIHAVVGLLKMWLRELPENILTEIALGEFLNQTKLMDRQNMLIELGNLVSALPLANYTLLRFLCSHLIRVIENSDKNKMTLKNISIIFSVTLGIPSNIFNMLLLEFDYIFWTNRCEDNQITEKTIKMYMDSTEDLSLDRRHIVRSSVNSTFYQEKAPKEFIMLERQLQTVASEELYDESNYSDGEFEVAYFASRHNANSNKLQDFY